MCLGVKHTRERVAEMVKEALNLPVSEGLKAAMQAWLDNMNVSDGTRERAEALKAALAAENSDNQLLKEIAELGQYFVKRSHWIFGGDGWAYDIGYGGLDHVLASGENVNVMVFDTEVYSNTGGQSSKAACCCYRQICGQRQTHPQKRPWHDGHELRLCLCSANRDGRR